MKFKSLNPLSALLIFLLAALPLPAETVDSALVEIEKNVAALPQTDSQIGLIAAFNEISFQAQSFLEWQGFETWRLLFFLIATVIAVIAGKTVSLLFSRLIRPAFAKRNYEVAERFANAVAPPASMLIFELGFYIGGAAIAHADINVFIYYFDFFMALFCATGAWMLYRFCDVAADAVIIVSRRRGVQVNAVLLMLLRASLKVVILGMSILFIGDQFGVKITTLLAGAGVMGLAVAFAAQDTIANVFGSVMVILDKPFNVGDYVKFEGIEGSVTAIGFRSTRLRTLEGHIITIPNKSCASAIITNVTERRFMRQIIDLGLIYETPPEKMKLAVKLLREIAASIPGTDISLPVTAHFSSFDAYAMTLRLKVYYSQSDASGNPGPIDFDAYTAWLNMLNMTILEKFNAEGFSFAYPTNVTYLMHGAAAPSDAKEIS